MFDHLEWWQVILLLSPIVLVMTLIRRHEQLRGCTRYEELSPYQKTWVLLQLLPPGLAAQYLLRLEVHELETYLKSGADIRGSGLMLHDRVMAEYLKGLPAPGEGSLHERLAKATLAKPEQALDHLELKWPRPELDQVPVPREDVATTSR